MTKCKWKEDSGSNYDTDCGQTFCMIYGTPKENDMKYCCFCGKEIDEISFIDDLDDEIEKERQDDKN